jgi:hypothetical protein
MYVYTIPESFKVRLIEYNIGFRTWKCSNDFYLLNSVRRIHWSLTKRIYEILLKSESRLFNLVNCTTKRGYSSVIHKGRLSLATSVKGKFWR